MWTSLLAATHYIALAIGFAGICLRLQALTSPKVGQSLKPLFLGDNLWGVAAIIWIVTGLLRAFAGFEKGSAFYLDSTGFWIKMGLFLGIFILELKPMLTFVRWRMAKKTEVLSEDLALIKNFAWASRIQVALTLVIPIVASFMARGRL